MEDKLCDESQTDAIKEVPESIKEKDNISDTRSEVPQTLDVKRLPSYITLAQASDMEENTDLEPRFTATGIVGITPHVTTGYVSHNELIQNNLMK